MKKVTTKIKKLYNIITACAIFLVAMMLPQISMAQSDQALKASAVVKNSDHLPATPAFVDPANMKPPACVAGSTKPSAEMDELRGAIAQRLKTEQKVHLDLFVMSECPFGVMAEQSIIPVVKEYGNKVELRLNFIAAEELQNGRTVFNSLHGQTEVDENIRQLIIARDYPEKLFDYLIQRAVKYHDDEWKISAINAGIDVQALGAAALRPESQALFSANIKQAQTLNIAASPTLLIDGVKFAGKVIDPGTAAATQCQTGADPFTGATWTVCSATATTAWITSAPGGGRYHALYICNQLGYANLGRFGGTCGNQCSYCVGGFSCTNPQSNTTFDGGGTSCGSDANGPLLCFTVHWECTGVLTCVPPSFTTCPNNITASTAANSCTAVVTYNPVAAGTSPTLTYTFSGATTASGSGTGSGATFNKGITTVTITATNGCGSATCTFTVTVKDNTPPIITCPPNIVVNTDPGKCYATVSFPTTMVLQYNPTGPQVSTTPVAPSTVAPNYSASNLSQAGSNNNWTNTDVWPVGQISSSPTPVAGEYLEFQVTVPAGTDLARVQYSKLAYLGNGATTASIRSSLDGFTSDISVIPVNPIGFEELSFDLSAMPIVSGAVTLRIYFYGAPVNKADWDDLVSTNRGGNGLRLYANNLASATDNCGPVSISYANFPSNYQYAKGVNTVVATATDGNNNSSSCSFTITVNDRELPTIQCPAAITVQCASQVPPPNTASVTASDNCPGVTVSFVSDNITPGNCPNRFTITRTYKATDASNNSSLCTQTITVADNTPPTMSCPPSVTVQCRGNVPPPAPTSVTTSDNCGGQVSVIWVSDVITNQTCVNRYTITRTYKATDACGNSATCTQTINVFDNTPPMIQCPGPITVQCSGDVPAPDFESVTASDNCGDVTVTWGGDVISNQTCPNRYTITRTYKATDACGNSATCTQTITVNDMTPPTIQCPPSVTVQCASAVPPRDFAGGSASDNCGGATVTWVSDVISNQTCLSRYTITRTYKATDACGNTATCTQTITVFDNTPPTIQCPPSLTVQCAGAVPPPAPTTVTASDNCGPVTVSWVTDVISNQTCVNRYTITRIYIAVDPCGNFATCTQTITVNDNTPPTITCPAAVFVQCASAVPPPATATVTASDNCGPVTVSWVSDVVSDSTCPNHFTITRTYRATDACGNSATCTQIISVKDNTPPTLTCPAAVTVQCASAVPQPAPSTVTASDNCGVVTVTFGGDVISNRVCDNRYTITRTYRATDACGNFATCTQIITVNDNTPPTITCPATVTVQCASAVPAPAPSTVTASDNCGAVTVTWAGDAVSDSTCANKFKITRTYKATDACGNSATCTQTITVNDNTPPTIQCPAAVTVQCASAVPAPAPSTVTASDNCGGVTVVWSGDLITNQTCVNRYTIIRTYKATDACGNSATCTQTITVNDNTAPVITCPQGLTVQCASAVPAPNILALQVSDNCGGNIQVSWDGDVISNQTCANRYRITRTYRATDACGNSATCTQIITVFDNTPPTLTCPPNKTIPFTGTCTYNANPSNTGSPTNVADNCGGTVAVTYTDVVSQCGSGLIIIRTWKATDVCGNSTVCTQKITVTDNNTPYIIYATLEAKFGENNNINGDVGVTDANGKADFKKNDALDPYHVYAKNITVQMPATVNNKHFVPATGGPNPAFMTYSGTGGSGNFTQSVNGTVAGNYNNLTIKKNVIATVTGNDFGKITIEEGADVTFTASSINVQTIDMKKGKKNTTTTDIHFSGCTGVMVRDKVSVDNDCNVNVGGPKVIFYMGDNNSDPENFEVKGSNTQVTANIMIPHGNLHVSGGGDEEDDGGTIMTGWFMPEKLHSDGKNVTWNPYGCTPLNLRVPVTTEARPAEDLFQVKVYPNPSATDFTLQVMTTSTDPITVRIIDVNGIVLKANTTVKGSLVKIGSELASGTYFAEVMQGEHRQTVKLVKLN